MAFNKLLLTQNVIVPCFARNVECDFFCDILNTVYLSFADFESQRNKKLEMPAMDLTLIESLGRDLHSHSPGYMGEDEVCPWTLFLTMALTLLKGQD